MIFDDHVHGFDPGLPAGAVEQFGFELGDPPALSSTTSVLVILGIWPVSIRRWRRQL
jgi:hypothetical protein